MRVREVVRSGFIARWLTRRKGKWGALTLPDFRGGAVIYYWLTIDEEIAGHEKRVHVPQIERMGALKYLAVYAGVWLWLSIRHFSFRKAYDLHPMEQDPPPPSS